MNLKEFLKIAAISAFCAIGFQACDPSSDEMPLPETQTLDCNFFKTAQTLVDNPDLDVDYRVDCVMDVEAFIQIEPGVVIEFAADAGLYVRPGGGLKAEGSAALPIRFQGAIANAGYWKGILFDSPNQDNALKFVDIAHAGGGSLNGNNDLATIIIWGGAHLEIEACTIQDSENYGISAIYPDANWTIRESSVAGSANAPVVCLTPYLTAFDGTNDFTGNAKDYVLIDLGTESILEDLTWRRISVPYQITSTFQFFDVLLIEAGEVTIEPGTNIAFEDNTGIQIDEDGSLNAIGTPNSPITFTGVNPVSGAWKGIYFRFTQNTKNQIEEAVIEYAGATFDGKNTGILMWSNPRLSLTNVDFKEINGCSVYNYSLGDNPNLMVSGLNHSNTLGELCSD